MPTIMNQHTKPISILAGLLALATLTFTSCLDEDPRDRIDEEEAFDTPANMYLNTVANLNKIPKVVRFTIYNPTSTGVQFTPQYSVNNGQRWRGLDTYPYDFYVAAGGTAVATITSLPTNQPIMLRIKQTSGSSSEYCFIDDIEIGYESTWTPEYVLGDVDDDGNVGIGDIVALIDYLLSGDETGINMLAADLDGDTNITIGDVSDLIDMLLGS